MGTAKLYAYQGEMLPMAEISSRCGLDAMLIHNRLHRGWTMEAATGAPAQSTAQRYPYKGEMLTLRELADIGGVGENTIWWRMHKMHMTAEEAVHAKPDRKKRHLYRGEMLTMDEIAAKSGVARSTIRRRMTEYGLSADEAAVQHDASEWMSKYVYKGKHMTLARIAQVTGISRNTLVARLNQGWTLEEATARQADLKHSQSAKATQIPPEDDVPPEEREQHIAAQKIARTVTTPNLRDWHFRQVMSGVYAFDGALVAWQIVFGRGGQAHLKASWKKTGKPMDYDRAFDVDGERVKEIVPEWWT